MIFIFAINDRNEQQVASIYFAGRFLLLFEIFIKQKRPNFHPKAKKFPKF